MYQFFIIFSALSFLFSVLAAPLPSDRSLDKRSSGRGTWFNVGLDACGYTDTSSQPIVAVSHLIFNNGQYCNQYVSITANGVQEYGLVHDNCEGCGSGDLDMSTSLFTKFAPLTVGVVQITSWSFMPQGWAP